MKHLLTLLASILIFNVVAGQQNPDSSGDYVLHRLAIPTTEEAQQQHYMFNGFWDNWFASLSGGGQVYFGDEDGLRPLGDRITPTFEFAAGKWIHPVFGLRARVGGGDIKGYSTGTIPQIGHGYTKGGPSENHIYLQKWSQIFVDGEIMFDLSNIFNGYKRERVYSVITYVGVGMNSALYQPKKIDPDRVASCDLGIINRFRIAKYFDVNLELKGTRVDQTFDREQTLKYWEGYVAVIAGITYRFGEAGDRLFRKCHNSGPTNCHTVVTSL
ncbi:hypothetical protein HHL17_08610 [Chitinophaga sp. G-6-1-13]|uniref:Outer membrane protein beta-barrel domain-containing protein n=1 Tax=Chitinophaga fulva TaxID=2728842 RepID=A0A848GIM3_9BACT|nr:hypothetical protein [Chitinophaga fulva]NML37259.1 hypothetical protein [Chitinophaga fulva]